MVTRTEQLLTKDRGRNEEFGYIKPTEARIRLLSDLKKGRRVEVAVPEKVVVIGNAKCPTTNTPRSYVVTYTGRSDVMREVYNLARSYPAE